jgi:hypothetical protein
MGSKHKTEQKINYWNNFFKVLLYEEL